MKTLWITLLVGVIFLSVLTPAFAGVTIYYDVDKELGWVWINLSTEDCTILCYSKTNRVVWYSSGRRVFTQTYDEFLTEQGNKVLENLRESPIIIHRVNPTKPEIIY